MPRTASSAEPAAAPVCPRNDPAQYDDLAHVWWDPRGRFAMLQWLAAARAKVLPVPRRPGAPLLDVACGGGVLAPYVEGTGYRHVGVDLSATAARVAHEHGVHVVRGDALRLPFADRAFDVVVAGEALEHVIGWRGAVAEACRVLAPGGTLIVDTIARTPLARLVAVTIAERLPAGPPRRLHDPELFVDRAELVTECARHGVAMMLRGLRPSVPEYAAWLAGRRQTVSMVPTWSTAVLFQAVGVRKETA